MIRRFLKAIAARGWPRLRPVSLEPYRKIADEGAQIIQDAWSSGRMKTLEAKLRSRFSLYPSWEENSARLEADLLALRSVAGLAHVFLHHGDGRVRQEAIERLDGPMATPAEVVALAWRLNDWAGEVRACAVDTAQRRLARTHAAILVPALVELLPVIESWRRWSQREPQVIQDLTSRQDVLDKLASHILATRRAGAGALFRQACRSPLIDPYLEAMAAAAQMPNVRAMALDCVLAGKARIPTGDREVVWIDKSMGLFRLERRWMTRPLTIGANKVRSLERGATDRSKTVRKRVAQGLVDLMNDPAVEADIRRIALGMENDGSKGVRDRIAFIRNQGRM